MQEEELNVAVAGCRMPGSSWTRKIVDISWFLF